MNFNSIRYLFSEGLKNLLNNIFMALASIGVLTACLIVVGFSVLLKENVKNMVTFMGQQSSAIIFIKDEASKEQIDEFCSNLRNNQYIKEVTFTSKEQAIANYSKKLNDPVASKFLTEHNNILPASINIRIKDVDRMDEILNITKDPKYESIIIKTKTPENFTNMIKEFNRTANIFGSLLIIALISASLVIISNTIRAAVFSRRREIAIMKQVGATDGFVRFPFLIEGAAIGVISAFFAFCLTGILYKTIVLMLTENTSNFLNSMFSTMVSFNKVSLTMSFSFLLCGVIAGAIGSLISLRRYLKI